MNDTIQILAFMVAIILLTPAMGSYMAKVFMNQQHIMKPVFGWLERLIYRSTGIQSGEELNWKTYTFQLLIFNVFGFLIVFILQLIQQYLPLNPQHLPNVSWHLSFNTAVSFMTNTNWQSYAGETTLSHLVQMAGLTVQNFLSAATGIAVAIVLVRGLTKKTTENLGNFWVDVTRATCIYPAPIVDNFFNNSR